MGFFLLLFFGVCGLSLFGVLFVVACGVFVCFEFRGFFVCLLGWFCFGVFLTSEGKDGGDASSFCCWRISLQKIPSCSDVFSGGTVLSSINELQSQEEVNQPMSGDVYKHLVHKTPFRALIGPDNHCLITPEQEHWAPLLW